MSTKVEYRTCPLCEATCGLEIEVEGREIVKVRGDREDVFSAGFICPKGASLGELQSDPDRLTAPLVRRDGELVEASWDEAFEAIEAGLAPILADGDRNASRPTSATRTPTRSTARSTCRRCSRRSAPRTSSAPPRSISCRSRSPSGTCSAPG